MSLDRVAACKQILEQNPDDAFARYGLAMEYKQRGETALALEQFDELQTQHPDYTAGYQMSAQILISDGQIEAAEQRLNAGIAVARRSRNQHAQAEMEAMLEELEQQGR